MTWLGGPSHSLNEKMRRWTGGGVLPFSCPCCSWGRLSSCTTAARWSPWARSCSLSSCRLWPLCQTGRCTWGGEVGRGEGHGCAPVVVRALMSAIRSLGFSTHRSCLVRLTMEQTFSSPSIFGLPYSSSLTCCLGHKGNTWCQSSAHCGLWV